MKRKTPCDHVIAPETRRPWQFSIRQMLLAVFVVALVCGLLKACDFDLSAVYCLTVLLIGAFLERPIRRYVRMVEQAHGPRAARRCLAGMYAAAVPIVYAMALGVVYLVSWVAY